MSDIIFSVSEDEQIVFSSDGGDIYSTFISLTDAPSSYSGQAGKFIKVNDTASGLEFTTSTASVAWGGVTGTLSDQTDLQAALDAKEDTLTKGDLTETTSNVLSITGGTGSVIGSGVTIEVDQADTDNDGYLSSTDWDTFNGKESALTFSTGLTRSVNTITTNDSEIVHDDLSGFVSDEHVAHSSINLTAGDGLAGGGDISTNRTFNIDISPQDDIGTPASDDVLLIEDVTDGSIKKVQASEFTGGGGASQLSDLSDVNTSTPTDRNVLVADGVDWESRALVEADISDLGTYLENVVGDTSPQLGGDLDGQSAYDLTNIVNGTFSSTVQAEHLYTTDDLQVDDDILLGSGSVINFDSGNATITHSAGALTFNVFPVTPSEAPNADYEVANKKYVDDNAGGGSGSMTTVKEGGVQVGDADIITLNFNGDDFNLTESPDTEINININDAGIDHDSLQNFSADEHFTQADITTVGTIGTGTWQGSVIDYERGGLEADVSAYSGLIKISGGSTSQVSDNSADWDAAYTHVSNNGTDHSYIDQDVTTTANVSFAGVNQGSGYLVIPNGASPTVDTLGKIALDTTDNTLIVHDGTAARVIGHNIEQLTFTLTYDGNWDDEAFPIWQAPKDMAVEIVQVNATVMGSDTPTLDFNLEERAYASLGSAGTDVFGSDQTADADGFESTSFSNPQLAAKSHLVFTTGTSAESGAVDLITVTVYYRKLIE
jgi:hypothetical protein